MFFISGITTLLQTTWGNRLPIIQGGTFSFLTPAITICLMPELKEMGFEVKLQHIQGAVIVGAVFEIIIGASGLVGAMAAWTATRAPSSLVGVGENMLFGSSLVRFNVFVLT